MLWNALGNGQWWFYIIKNKLAKTCKLMAHMPTLGANKAGSVHLEKQECDTQKAAFLRHK